LAGTLYSIPFFIAAFVCPFLGILIDKIGKRGLMSKYLKFDLTLSLVMVSSFVMLLAYILTGILVTVDYGTE
jgi:MFS family permease